MCYDNAEITVGKLLARRIQICEDFFCKIHFYLFFKITFQITMSEQNESPQIQICLDEYILLC